MAYDFSDTQILVTGATAGIGEATAAAYAHGGANVWAVGRRKERLYTLRDRVADAGAEGAVEPVVLDVTDRKKVERMVKKGHGCLDVDILVNNAGLARGKGPLQAGQYSDWKEMVDTNIMGLLSMTQACMPALQARRGHIVNLGSVAGRWTYPGGNVYSATKHAVRALTDSMRIDLMGTGVRVTNIEPGLVETEFSLVRYHGNADKAQRVYDGYEVLDADDIAETILWATSRPHHVNVQELVVFPTDQASVRDIVRAD